MPREAHELRWVAHSIEGYHARFLVLEYRHWLVFLVGGMADVVDDELASPYVLLTRLDRIPMHSAQLAQDGDDVLTVQIVEVRARLAREIVFCKRVL
jgi:hypothetical protein